jgi:hypothetical protein
MVHVRTSPSLIHACNNRPADSIGRQYARTVTKVDIVGSSKCHTRHLATTVLVLAGGPFQLRPGY